ncbi:unnamed protein product [Anisakis simplex]|uniref:7TM_GPCR_Srx domain-containing protein n=1 Tax=Anisakis simplex TaxID=6269 RepID=A0A0M3J0Y7_ANISI|nr:unnamed protein product [Anisakis simplex]
MHVSALIKRPPKYESISVGILYILMNSIGIFTSSIIIAGILLEKSMRTSQCYRMMLCISVLGIIQQVIGLISGFLTIWPLENVYATKIAGALFEPMWMCMLYFIFLLSVNRLGIVSTSYVYKNWITSICNVLSLVSILLGLGFVIAFLTPNVTMRYDPYIYAWRYFHTTEAFIVAMFEACSLTPLSILSLVNYIGILIAIYRKVSSIHSGGAQIQLPL